MEKILLKKSYQFKNNQIIKYTDLWNTKGVFTTIRLHGKKKKLILFNEHIKNINKSLKKFEINFKLTKKIFYNLFFQYLNKKIYYNHLLRIAINKETISFSLRKRPKISKNYTIKIKFYKRSSPTYKHLKYRKVLNYLKQIDKKKEEIIFLNKNIVLEGCTTNIICVKNGILYSPNKNIYKGITLLFFKKKLGKKIIFRDITKNFLRDCDEIILIGSGKGVVRVKSIPQIFWTSKENKIFNYLYSVYNYLLKNDIK